MEARRAMPGRTTWRTHAAIAAASTAVFAGLAAAPVAGVWMAVPAATAVGSALGVIIAGRGARRFQAAVAGAVGVASLGATAGVVLTGMTYASDDTAVTAWALAETAALFLLTLVTVRVSPPRSAAAAATLSGIAIPAWVLRFGGEVTSAMLGGFAVWGLFSLLAVTAGLYLRALDERRSRSVAQARRAQRDQFARDLHDFVAWRVAAFLPLPPHGGPRHG